jgi:superfamily II DNA or RNA helicase
VSAPRVLDEGVDVPAADLAVIVGASSSRRQMIRRMGRILRRKSDGRLARLAVVLVEGRSRTPPPARTKGSSAR